VRICIIIPAYNESANIGPLVEGARCKHLDVVVVDDGSTDATGEIAREKGADVIRHGQTNGKGYCLREGFNYALKRGYDGVITMDGDGQHAVEDIDKFLEAARKYQTSVVNGNRMTDSRGMPFVRFCTNKFMSRLISLACRQFVADTQCGFRYIGCEVLRRVDLSCRGFEIETEIIMKACKKGFKVYGVPVQTIYRDEKSKINPLRDTVRFFVYFIKELFSRD
jgi:glycosyltransferase involved in cell wall biosynthesis